MAVAKNHYNKTQLKDRYCANCGEPIIVKNSKVRFCSDNCRIQKWRSRQKERNGKSLPKKKGGKK